MPITSPCDSVSVSEVKPQKAGLNRRPKDHTVGGGGAGSHPTPSVLYTGKRVCDAP